MVAAGGTVGIAAGAFWLSFTALTDLAARSGVAGQPWVWPLIVDGIIVVATVAAVALADRHEAWYPWLLLFGGATISITANAIHAVIAAAPDVPAVLAAAVAAIPPVVLLAITHLTVLLTRPGAGSNPTVENESEALPQSKRLRLTTKLRPDEDSRPSGPSHAPVFVDEAPAEPPVDRRAYAASRRSAGWSNRRIARELGVHPATVGRWFTASAPGDHEDEGGPS